MRKKLEDGIAGNIPRPVGGWGCYTPPWKLNPLENCVLLVVYLAWIPPLFSWVFSFIVSTFGSFTCMVFKMEYNFFSIWSIFSSILFYILYLFSSLFFSICFLLWFINISILSSISVINITLEYEKSISFNILQVISFTWLFNWDNFVLKSSFYSNKLCDLSRGLIGVVVLELSFYWENSNTSMFCLYYKLWLSFKREFIGKGYRVLRIRNF